MEIRWVRCLNYENARQFEGIVYLHEWNGAPFYWGKADGSTFGRRYNVGYRHWIEGCLKHGARLYIGEINDLEGYCLDDVEACLIKEYGSVMNKRIKTTALEEITHRGNVPESINALSGLRID